MCKWFLFSKAVYFHLDLSKIRAAFVVNQGQMVGVLLIAILHIRLYPSISVSQFQKRPEPFRQEGRHDAKADVSGDGQQEAVEKQRPEPE